MPRPLSRADRKRLRVLHEWVASALDGAMVPISMDREWAKGEIRHFELALAERRSPRRKERAAGTTKEQRRDERRANLSKVREQVMARLGGKCEVCAERPAADAHHVEGGGLRRHTETAGMMLALCRECHRLIHAYDEGTLGSALLYCEMRGMRSAAAVLRRKWDKANAARSVRAEAGR